MCNIKNYETLKVIKKRKQFTCPHFRREVLLMQTNPHHYILSVNSLTTIQTIITLK